MNSQRKCPRITSKGRPWRQKPGSLRKALVTALDVDSHVSEKGDYLRGVAVFRSMALAAVSLAESYQQSVDTLLDYCDTLYLNQWTGS